MKLDFIPKRLQIIKRLKGLTTVEIERKMQKIGGHKKRMNVDRWDKGKNLPREFEKVTLLAEATGVPVGFYYYKNVRIEMFNMKVEILIKDTEEVIIFDFI